VSPAFHCGSGATAHLPFPLGTLVSISLAVHGAPISVHSWPASSACHSTSPMPGMVLTCLASISFCQKSATCRVFGSVMSTFHVPSSPTENQRAPFCQASAVNQAGWSGMKLPISPPWAWIVAACWAYSAQVAGGLRPAAS
jgi:hypothetical protein